MLNRLLQKTLYDSLKLTAPQNHKIILWIIWLIFSFVFFEVILDQKNFSTGNSTAEHYFLGIVVVAMAYCDYIFFKRTEISKKGICICTYVYNAVWMIPGIVLANITWNSFGFDPLIRESVSIFYWILSIPLVIIYDIKLWVIGAVSIYLNSILYFVLLKRLAENYDCFSFVYILFTIGICLVATIISVLIFKYRINQIYNNIKSDK